MPFIPNTPESLIGRSDSKDPSTTCRGITGSGRPCRRPLNASPSGSPEASRIKVPKVSKVGGLRVDDPADPDCYCWQHKDQASMSAHSSPGPRPTNTPILEERESLDGLMDRLGIAEAKQKKSKKNGRPSMSSNHNGGNEKITETNYPPRPASQSSNRWTKRETIFCCCFTIPIMEEEPPAPTRPQPRPVQSAPAAVAGGGPSSKLPSNSHLSPSSAGSRPSMGSPAPSKQSTTSQTSQYLTLIPPTASPQTASQLMAELAKPISQGDEAGYIYIFWLTPESEPMDPPAEAARSLLAPPSQSNGRQRRPSDVVESFAARNTPSSSGKDKTLLLKIGRASNVQRRLNEWTRQCGYNLSLIRYYPHIPSATPSTPRKMPHSHKVERLIHLELAGAGLRISDRENWNCEACGKAHKEWFEVDASRAGIEMVDEVVRRWSDWDEARG